MPPVAPWRAWGRLWDRFRERGIPPRFRFWDKHGLVRRSWYHRLRLRSTLSSRIRIGFGPITDGENTLGLRKWHIDPIVDAINRSSRDYVCDIFFAGEDLARYDVAVIVKLFDRLNLDVVRRRSAARLVYDTADIRYVRTPAGLRDIYEDREAFEHYTKFLRSMDAVILASPLQREDLRDIDVPQVQIPRPLLNRRHRTTYRNETTLRLIWQGYPENLPTMRTLHPIVHRLRRETGLDVRLVYDTSGRPRQDGPIQYTRWSIRRWDRVLAAADVGVVIKPVGDSFQQRKAPTKLVSYMAAGLPVVCTPSAADRDVIQHGRTGYFAYDDREWHDRLAALLADASLRERIGTAGRLDVERRYSLDRIVPQYVRLFDQLTSSRGFASGRRDLSDR